MSDPLDAVSDTEIEATLGQSFMATLLANADAADMAERAPARMTGHEVREQMAKANAAMRDNADTARTRLLAFKDRYLAAVDAKLEAKEAELRSAAEAKAQALDARIAALESELADKRAARATLDAALDVAIARERSETRASRDLRLSGIEAEIEALDATIAGADAALGETMKRVNA